MSWFSIVLRPFIWLNQREPGLFETISGLAAIGWGALALQVFPPADRPDSLGVYASFGVETAVALTVLVLGVGQLVVFDLIDRRWEEHWLRWWGALLLLTHWLILSGSAVLMSDTATAPGVAALVALAIGNFSLCLRIVDRDEISGDNRGRR